MNRKGILLMAVVIPNLFLVPAQEKLTIKQFDQYYRLLPAGNVKAVWDITIIPGEGTKSMLLHAFFSAKAYIKDVAVTDSEGSLNSKMISKEGVPILEINFRERLPPGAEYHFTCNLDVWKAVDIGETEGSFTLLTGYNFPIEVLNITTVLPEGTRLRNFFPADGKVSSEKGTILWVMNSLPAGYTIQVSVSFDVLSEEFADNLFDDGMNLYNLQDLENASSKFEQALELYRSLNLQEKADECALYLDRIEGLREGLPIFTEAVSLYDSGNYTEALAKFNQVRSIYEDHNLPTDRIDEYISKSSTFLEAYSEFQKGEKALEKNEEEARNHFERARQLFSEVEDTSMIERIDRLLEQILREEGAESEKKIPLSLVGAVIAVFGAAASILVATRLRKPAPVHTEEEIREEMRQLKARFVYGEINKREYEEKLAELERKLKQYKQ